MDSSMVLANLIIKCMHKAKHNMVNDLRIDFLFYHFYLNFNLSQVFTHFRFLPMVKNLEIMA